MNGVDGPWDWPQDGGDPDQGAGHEPQPADGAGGEWSGYGGELEPGYGGDPWADYAGRGPELGDPEPGYGDDLPSGYGGDAASGYGGVDPHVDEPLGLADPAGPDPDPAESGAGSTEAAGPVFGAPERLEPDGWADPQFPPPLALGALPEPVDGPPWSDAGLLGSEPVPGMTVPGMTVTGGTDAAALLEYAALDDPGGSDAWAALLACDDPAAAALARWWAPPR